MAANTKYGKIVWAKVKGSCPWPAKGVDPIPGIRRPVKRGNWYFVRFYGSNDHAWIDYDTHIWPYKEFRVRYGDKDKCTNQFREGVAQADLDYSELPEADLPTAENELTATYYPEVKQKSKQTKKVKTKAAAAKKRKADTTAAAVKSENGRLSQENKNKTSLVASDQAAAGGDISPVKSPRLSRALTSPRRTDLKAQVYDFVDNETQLSSHTISNKSKIKPTKLRIGFLGLGTMGLPMVKNLIKYGHNVTVWNRTMDKCSEVADVDVEIGDTPAEVVSMCDVTIACLSDPFAVKEVLFCKNGVLEAIKPGKGFVDMSTVDVETVTDADEQIRRLGGMFLEAPIIGSKAHATNGTLTVMASGSDKLYEMCVSCFQAMGAKSYFLGGVGNGTRMKLCINMVMGSITSAVAEGMALADRIGIKQRDLYDVLSSGPCGSQLVNSSAKAILEEDFTPQLTLKHIQKDLRLAIDMADMYDQPLQVAAAANELFKRAKSLGMSNQDTSSVYKAANK